VSRLFCCSFGRGVRGWIFWFRILGVGLHFKKPDKMGTGMLFSERYMIGCAKVFGVIVRPLRREPW